MPNRTKKGFSHATSNVGPEPDDLALALPLHIMSEVEPLIAVARRQDRTRQD
jgi:hypothetical protein